MTTAQIITVVLGSLTAITALVTAIIALVRARPQTLIDLIKGAQESLALSGALRDAMLKDMNSMKVELEKYKRTIQESNETITALKKKIDILSDAIRALIDQLKKMGIDPECSDEAMQLLQNGDT